MSKPMEVTVNSGGVVYFAIFKVDPESDRGERETAAVLKFTPSRLVTQSERLGYEIAKHMGVSCPQSRVIHKGSCEWEQLKKAVVKCTALNKDAENEATYMEFIEAMDLSQCVLLMGYMQGSPLFENNQPFATQNAAKNTAAALGKVFLLDLVLRNEDRLFCSELGWRGNPANLLCTENPPLGQQHMLNLYSQTSTEHGGTKQRKFPSLGSLYGFQNHESLLCMDALVDKQAHDLQNCEFGNFYIVIIDSGVPRRPPAGKRAHDKLQYPKLVELVLNSTDYAASILHEISSGHLGFSREEVPKNTYMNVAMTDQVQVIKAFQSGLRRSIRNMQTFYVFLLKLYRMLDILLHKFFWAMSSSLPAECGDSHVQGSSLGHCASPRAAKEVQFAHFESIPQKEKENGDVSRNFLQETQHFKEPNSADSHIEKSSGTKSPGYESPKLDKRLTLKLKDVNRNAKVFTELNDELNHWNEVLYTEGRLLCHENGFVSGFLEGGGNHSVVDSYELKVRLEHILERMSYISQAADTERPSQVLENLFIGGALAANSVYTLHHLGITHILCLCPSELKSFGDELTASFHYKEIQILDMETADISCNFEEACEFIDDCGKAGGKALVHCFEGRSRSATVVLAYLMMRKNQTLLQAWDQLKSVHSRACPNDGFMGALIDLDRKIYGTNSMDWQKKKPTLQTCPICGKSAGLSISSLRYHLEKWHPEYRSAEK